MLLAFALCMVASYVAAIAVYNLFFHPLAKEPGPFLARISSIPSFYHACKGSRHIWIWQQFQIYGPKFRATPNTILFNSPQAFTDIYSHRSNVKKAPLYKTWVRNAEDAHVFNTVDPVLHAKKRRLVSMAFTEKSLKGAAPFIARHVDRWGELLLGDESDHDVAKDDGWSAPRNMTKWADHLVFDILGELCFGKSFETKEPGENPLKGVPDLIFRHLTMGYKLAKSPFLPILLTIRPLLDHVRRTTTTAYDAFIQASVTARIAQEQDPTASPRQDFFHFLYHAQDSKTGARISFPHLLAETRFLVLAGSDTTAITLCSLFFYLTRYPRVLQKVTQEVRQSFSDPDAITYGAPLAGCKYLRAVIDETLRLVPPIPSELPREVLPSGATVAGDFYPAGIIVGTAGWSLGRNEALYGDAYTFRPERWIASSDLDTLNTEADIQRLKQGFHPFAGGPTNCLGSNVAILELGVAVGRTLWRFDVRGLEGERRGEGREELGWGQRDARQFILRDAYLSARDGPVVQFRERRD